MKTLRAILSLVLAVALFVALFTLASVTSAATTNILLTISAPWRYQTNNLDGTNWMAAAYNDSGWFGPGNALLYIETSTSIPATLNTPVQPATGSALPLNTYYFRTTFNLTNLAGLNQLVFSNLVDDGAVYYLNGVEIQRLYMPTGPVVNSTLSSASHEASSWDIFSIGGDTLTNAVTGTNVLAAEVHQTAANSSDIVFGTAVSAIYGATTNVVRGPYLQSSGTNRIVIRWRTDAATASRVDYGTNPGALNTTINDSTFTTEHIVTLTNLSPDSKYYYAIGAPDRLLAGSTTNHFFLTHPLPGTTKPLRVWVIGDAGTATANQIAVRNAFETYNGTNTVHAWLQLGDNAYNSGLDSEFQSAVFNMYTNELRNIVTWPTLGNHETIQSTAFVDTYPHFQIFTLPTAGECGGVPSGTEHWYSFDLGMVHFICLDSMTADKSTNGAMLTWLKSDLAVTTNRWLVAYWHHPPYTKGSHNSDTELDLGQVRTNFLPILEAGGVDLVLSGHSHCYERSYLLNGHTGTTNTFTNSFIIQPGGGRDTNGVGPYRKPDGLGEKPVGNRGTVYIVGGSSGQATGGGLNHPAMFYSANNLGSVVLDFNSNRLDVTFVRETGATDDSFTLIKEGTYPPRVSSFTAQNPGNATFTVLSRAYRTNLVETGTNLATWTPLLTNFSTNTSFNVTTPATNSRQFFRIRRP